MVEQGWIASEIMQEYLQNLMSWGFMTAVQLMSCHVSKDLASPMPTGGYIMACVAFYECGFGVPSHRFLRSLLQFYGLELHHLNPLGILHIAAFVTFCEAYMGTPLQYVELLLLHPVLAGLGRESSSSGWCGPLHQI
jgi:hypothetical protein